LGSEGPTHRGWPADFALWASSKLVSVMAEFVSRCLREPGFCEGCSFLRRAALVQTWRYFSEFSTEEHNWLIPENVRSSRLAIAARAFADQYWIFASMHGKCL